MKRPRAFVTRVIAMAAVLAFPVWCVAERGDAGMFVPVRESIAEAMKQTGVASVSIAVAKDGEMVWEEGFGFADRDRQIDATPYTAYAVASITKAFTATGLMVLVDQGRVDVEAPANRYLGSSPLVARVGSADEATVKRLLVHTAGLPLHWNILRPSEFGLRLDPAESIRRYGVLVNVPGARYNYSNFGYAVIEHIIEAVSGKDYAVFMKEDVFDPLGLTDTSIGLDSGRVETTAIMYGGDKTPVGPYDYDHRGASAAYASAHDLVRFGMFHLGGETGGGKPLLKPETLRRIHDEVGSQFRDGSRTVDYLLGSIGAVDYGGYRLWVVSGGMPGATARLAMVPSRNVVCAVVCNGGDVDLWSIEKKVIEALVDDFDGAEPETGEAPVAKSDVPQAFPGTWSGHIATYEREIPVVLKFDEKGTGSLEINGRTAPSVGVETPLGRMGFDDGRFRGLYMGQINTRDASRSFHVVLIECAVYEGNLVGTASAVAANHMFCLPYTFELSRQ